MGNQPARPGGGARAEVLHTVGGCSASARVMLHVYDIGVLQHTVLRSMARSLGLSMFEFAVEVYGLEWSFCKSGISWSSAGDGYTRGPARFRQRSHLLGVTFKSREEVFVMMQALSKQWVGDAFEVRLRNSGHFSREACESLGVGPYPKWAEAMIRYDASSSMWSMCCVESARNSPVLLETWSGASSSTPRSEGDNLEFVVPREFEHWCDEFVTSLQCERAISPPLPAGPGRPSAVRPRPITPPSPHAGALYHLVRERWLRSRRGKGPSTSAFSVRPLWHVCPVPTPLPMEYDYDEDLGDDILDPVPLDALLSGDVNALSGAAMAEQFRVEAFLDEEDVGLEVGPGSPVVILSVSPNRPDLDSVRPGDIIEYAGGARILCLDDFKSSVTQAVAAGDESISIMISRCSPARTHAELQGPTHEVGIAEFADQIPNVEGLATFSRWVDDFVEALGNRGSAPPMTPRSSSPGRLLGASGRPRGSRGSSWPPRAGGGGHHARELEVGRFLNSRGSPGAERQKIAHL